MKNLLIVFLLTVSVNVFSQDTLIAGGKYYEVCIINLSNINVTYIYNGETKTQPLKYFDDIKYYTAPKGSNLIEYKSDSISDFDLLKAWVNHLKKQGYRFETIDKDFYFIETELTKIQKSYNVKLSISISGNDVLIRSYGSGDIKSIGIWGSGGGGSIGNRDDATLRGNKKGIKSNYAYVAFEQAEKLAKLFMQQHGGHIVFKEEIM